MAGRPRAAAGGLRRTLGVLGVGVGGGLLALGAATKGAGLAARATVRYTRRRRGRACPACGGGGEEQCQVCAGSGRVARPGFPGAAQCPVCRGGGRIGCLNCLGERYV